LIDKSSDDNKTLTRIHSLESTKELFILEISHFQIKSIVINDKFCDYLTIDNEQIRT